MGGVVFSVFEASVTLETKNQDISALNLNFAFIHLLEIPQLYGDAVQNCWSNPLRKVWGVTPNIYTTQDNF